MERQEGAKNKRRRTHGVGSRFSLLSRLELRTGAGERVVPAQGSQYGNNDEKSAVVYTWRTCDWSRPLRCRSTTRSPSSCQALLYACCYRLARLRGNSSSRHSCASRRGQAHRRAASRWSC